jgi:hypothetical protein
MLKSKITIKDTKTLNLSSNRLIFDTKKDYRLINGQYINLNGNSVLYDLDIKRISQYIHKKEIQRINTINKTLGVKLDYLHNLKRILNIKRKSYIDNLRLITSDILKDNPINLFSDIDFKHYAYITQKLKDYKIIVSDLGYFQTLHIYLYLRDNQTLNKLINLDNDIIRIKDKINHFKDYYQQITKYRFKINSYDINLLDRGIISQNIREVFYFYLIKLKKVKRFKSNDLLNFKVFKFGLDLDKAINDIRENLFKSEFKNIIDDINLINDTYQNNILNKYI